VIEEHSEFVQYFPMSIFYCLYFCIYFRNPSLVDFFRTLVHKMDHQIDKIEEILYYIDTNGVFSIRQSESPLNQYVYHMVLYQAMNDKLRLVYSQIIRKLKQI